MADKAKTDVRNPADARVKATKRTVSAIKQIRLVSNMANANWALSSDERYQIAEAITAASQDAVDALTGAVEESTGGFSLT